MSTVSTGRNVMVQGRLVFVVGDLFKGRQKVDQNTRQPMVDQQGQPIMEYGFGLAVPKSVLSQAGVGQPGEIWTAMHEEAYQIYPSRQLPPDFAWKYKDGDGVDHNGASFATREGYPQNLVFALTTRLPIKYFKHEGAGLVMVNEGIKCGDYVQVQVQVKAHGKMGQGKPGLYLNPMAVLFLGYGKEIVNTPSGEQIFGTSAPPLPPGASATPLSPHPGMLVQPPASPQFQQPSVAPQFGVPQAAPQAVAPHYGVLPPTHQPQNQPVGNAPVVPAMPQYGTPSPQMTGPGAMPPAYPSSAMPTSQGMPAMPGIPQYGR